MLFLISARAFIMWLNVETKRAVTSIFMPFKTLIFRLSKKHKIQISVRKRGFFVQNVFSIGSGQKREDAVLSHRSTHKTFYLLTFTD